MWVCTFFLKLFVTCRCRLRKILLLSQCGTFPCHFRLHTNTTLLLMLVLFYYFLLLQLKLLYFYVKKLILSQRKIICQKMDFLRLCLIKIQYERHRLLLFVYAAGICSASWFIARGIFRFFLFDVSNLIKIMHKMRTSVMFLLWASIDEK